MKKFIFKILCLFICSGLASFEIHAQNKYDKRVHRYRTTWERMIPTHTKIQFAGDMGLLSFGTGWDYGKHNQWETDIFLGFIPKYATDKAKATFTLKQNYMPWSLHLNKKFSVEPLACGVYFNTVLNGDFWVHQPDKYPNKYYQVPSKIRIHVFAGQRLTYDIDEARRYTAKSITLFYELSTCDLYIISRIGNSSLKPRDYLRLSFGMKLQLF